MTLCQAQESNIFAHKTYSHTYIYKSMMNEYGKGGGNVSLELIFGRHNVKLINMSSRTLPDVDGVYHTKRDSSEIFTATYKVEKDSILVDNLILPLLKIEDNKLIAPSIHLEETHLKVTPKVSQNVVFYINKRD